MAKVKTKQAAKWRKTPPVKTVRAKYQAARRVKFKPVEIIRESEYKHEKKQ